MKYERLTTRKVVALLNIIDEKSVTVQGYLRLAELEDKIESGELVEVPKGAVVLTPEERAEGMRLANEERKQVVREFLKLLKEKESPKLLMWEYGEGYLDCIKTAEELAAQYSVEVEE